MAYADKSCDMRRCCVARGGHVEWEGVEIDGCVFVLVNRTGWGEIQSTAYLKEDKLIEKIKELNSDSSYDGEDYVLLYQDEEDCNWDVKTDYVKEMEKENNG